MTFENAQAPEPSDNTPVIDLGNADAAGGLTFDPAKYGLEPDFGQEGMFQADEVAENGQEEAIEEGEEDTASTEADSQEEEVDEPFILNDIDLSSIPKELRRDTIEDTVKAITEAQKAKEQEAETALNQLKEITKEKSGSFIDTYHKQIKDLDAEIEFRFKEAKDILQREVDSGLKTEAQANFEYGQYKEQVKGIREKHISDAYVKTNEAIIENFVQSNLEVFQSNPTIAQAAKVMIADIMADGNLVSTERSVSYLNLGKQLYDEGFKAGLASLKKTAEKQQLTDVKKRVSNPTTQRGGSSPKPKGNPYASAEDIPFEQWKNLPQEVRTQLLQKDLMGAFSLKSN